MTRGAGKSGGWLAPFAGLAVVAGFGLGGCGDNHSRSTGGKSPPAAATKPLRDREPNDRSTQASGPLGPAGIVLTKQRDGDNEDWFYFRLRPGKPLRLLVKHLDGRCGNSFVQTRYAGKPGPGSGGQDQTAYAANAPVIDTNGNRAPDVGDTPGEVFPT